MGARLKLSLLILATIIFGGGIGISKVSASPTFTEYTTTSHPYEITTGSDGNLWFTNENAGTINRITTTGTITSYSISSKLLAPGAPFAITSGPDNNLWFTVDPPNPTYIGEIGRITTSGTITMYSLPTGYVPQFITSGPDGNLWFTENIGDGSSGAIGKITTSGTVTQYSYSSSCPRLEGVTSGSDGNLWFAENAGSGCSTGPAIASITTSGTITRYSITAFGARPYSITSGPDDNLWFTDVGNGKIDTMTTSGTVLGEHQAQSTRAIASGPDGALWFTDQNDGKIGRVSTSGTITQYSVPTSSSSPYGITSGPDGAIWFTEQSGNKIGRITTPQPSPQPTYYTKNDGTNFVRSTSPFESGVATQSINSDGSVTVSVNSAPGYADSGYVLYEGTLGNLPDFAVNGSGDNFGLNLWFDTGNNNEYFAWDSSNVLTSLNGDTYGLSSGSQSGSLSVSNSTQFFMMSDGQNHSLSDLKNGYVSGIDSNTKVAVWIGVDVASGGSTSATISSVSGL